MRSGRFALLFAGAVLLPAALGCGTREVREADPGVAVAASAVEAGAGPGYLYDLPAMQKARLHRERGARRLEAAYLALDVDRELGFGAAMNEFRQAEYAYHEALAVAPERYRPVIENEIARVATYMRQIQRDRASAR